MSEDVPLFDPELDQLTIDGPVELNITCLMQAQTSVLGLYWVILDRRANAPLEWGTTELPNWAAERLYLGSKVMQLVTTMRGYLPTF
jgi:hypothetical protein